MPYPATLDEICAALTARGCPALARRLAYFASDADLEPGDVPLTLASALGFWSFFRRVDSEGQVSLTCTAEGWLCGSWDFADRRAASLLFLDAQRALFAATAANGQWVEMDGGGDTGGLDEVTAKLVEAGLFTWHPKPIVNRNSPPDITLPDTAGVLGIANLPSIQ